MKNVNALIEEDNNDIETEIEEEESSYKPIDNEIDFR